MTVGLASAVLDGWLNALCNATNYTAPVAFWSKLHTADPDVGATAAFGDATRKSTSFGVAGAGGGSRQCATDASTDWTNLTAAGTISHLSFWAPPRRATSSARRP